MFSYMFIYVPLFFLYLHYIFLDFPICSLSFSYMFPICSLYFPIVSYMFLICFLYFSYIVIYCQHLPNLIILSIQAILPVCLPNCWQILTILTHLAPKLIQHEAKHLPFFVERTTTVLKTITCAPYLDPTDVHRQLIQGGSGIRRIADALYFSGRACVGGVEWGGENSMRGASRERAGNASVENLHRKKISNKICPFQQTWSNSTK